MNRLPSIRVPLNITRPSSLEVAQQPLVELVGVEPSVGM